MTGMSEVTQILGRIQRGDPHATAQLIPLVYSELRKVAAKYSNPQLSLMLWMTPGST